MPTPSHMMLDIETLGTKPGSVILSIAVVPFDPYAGTFGAAWYRAIGLESACVCGLRIEPDTLLWWMEQDEAARDLAFFPESPVSLPTALLELGRLLKGVPDLRLWGHGATFDPVLFAAACDACRLPVPWEFRNVRDTRTLFDLAGIADLETYRAPNEVKHDPRADALAQARAVAHAYRLIGRSPVADVA